MHFSPFSLTFTFMVKIDDQLGVYNIFIIITKNGKETGVRCIQGPVYIEMW